MLQFCHSLGCPDRKEVAVRNNLPAIAQPARCHYNHHANMPPTTVILRAAPFADLRIYAFRLQCRHYQRLHRS